MVRNVLEVDPVLASRTLFRQAQSFEVKHVDRTPLRRGPADVRLEFVVGQPACGRQNVDDELVDHPDHARAAWRGGIPHRERVVGDLEKLLRRAIGKFAQSRDPTPIVFRGRRNENVDVAGLARQSVERKRVAADQHVFRTVPLQRLDQTEDVAPPGTPGAF
jgi:hypothetical protein